MPSSPTHSSVTPYRARARAVPVCTPKKKPITIEPNAHSSVGTAFPKPSNAQIAITMMIAIMLAVRSIHSDIKASCMNAETLMSQDTNVSAHRVYYAVHSPPTVTLLPAAGCVMVTSTPRRAQRSYTAEATA